MTLEFAPSSAASLPLWLMRPSDGDAGQIELPAELSDLQRRWAMAQGFAGKAGQLCLLPAADGGLAGALFGLGPMPGPRGPRDRHVLARAAEALPAGAWHLVNIPTGFDAQMGVFGWLLAQYRFGRYRQVETPQARLVCPPGVDADRLLALAAGEFLARDLINTPASDMGPQALEQAARDLAQRHGAGIEVIRGEDLLAQHLGLIHAVGRAAAQPPRLIDIRFPGRGPRLTLVGKGVCFDTGGLDIKPPASMALMKKDMGGAANVLGLAETLARLGLTAGMQLRVLIPAVENAISADAFRPGDILTGRKGLSVEINNTDAEGRLILADALALADEEAPDLLISMATLTGAARVALGPDLPPFFCDDDEAAAAIQQAGRDHADPVWRLPFWEPYETLIEPGIADLDNAPSGGFAGAITAALFLRRFTEKARLFAHFDIYGWQPTAAPGRPKGGLGQGMRAILHALPQILTPAETST